MEKFNPAMLKHNVFIVWNPEYNLGIPIIDEQHRGIVSTINSLHFGLQNNYGKDMFSPIIDMMHNYTRIHFQLEESFLEKIDSPNAKRHHELHRDLSSKLDDIGRDITLNKDPYQFMDFLKNWWINHICNEDLIYKDYGKH
jgi:hemerythrin